MTKLTASWLLAGRDSTPAGPIQAFVCERPDQPSQLLAWPDAGRKRDLGSPIGFSAQDSGSTDARGKKSPGGQLRARLVTSSTK